MVSSQMFTSEEFVVPVHAALLYTRIVTEHHIHIFWSNYDNGPHITIILTISYVNTIVINFNLWMATVSRRSLCVYSLFNKSSRPFLWNTKLNFFARPFTFELYVNNIEQHRIIKSQYTIMVCAWTQFAVCGRDFLWKICYQTEYLPKDVRFAKSAIISLSPCSFLRSSFS